MRGRARLNDEQRAAANARRNEQRRAQRHNEDRRAEFAARNGQRREQRPHEDRHAEYDERNAQRLNEDRHAEYDERNERRREQRPNEDRRAEYDDRNEQRQNENRGPEYEARNEQRQNENRRPEYNVRNLLRNAARAEERRRRDPVDLLVDVAIRLAQDRGENEAQHPAALDRALDAFEQRLPPAADNDINVANHNAEYVNATVLEARDRFWRAIAPAPTDCEPPRQLTEQQIALAVDRFAAEVHCARVVRCGWCGELSIDSGPPHRVDIDDPRMVPARAANQPPRDPAREQFDERNNVKGYIKALVADDGTVEVCARCNEAFEANAADKVWQTAIDFGVLPLELRDLSDPERAFIALNHPLCKIVKVAMGSGAQAHTGRGHTITFPQNSANAYNAAVRARELPLLRDATQVVALHFVGPRGTLTDVGGTLRAGPLRADPNRINAAFQYLRRSHPDYRDRIVNRAVDYRALIDDIIAQAIITDAAAHNNNNNNNRNRNQDDGAEDAQPPLDPEEMAGRRIADRAAAHVAANDFEAADAHQAQVEPLVMEGPVAMNAPPPPRREQEADPRQFRRWLAEQDADPINEFEANKRLMNGAFPHLFPTAAFPCDALPPERMTRHLMLYYDKRFQCEPSFVFLLNNQRLRHNICRNNARVDPLFVQQVTDRLANVDARANFVALLDGALRTRDAGGDGAMSREQREAYEFAKRTMRVSMRNIAFSGEGDRAPGLWNIFSIMRCRGLPSYFLTMSPSAIDNSLGMRLAVPTIDDVLGIAGHMNYDARSRAVFAAPASSALFFTHFQRAVAEVLLGARLGAKATTGVPNIAGVLGVVTEFFSATECQGRTLLHFHMLVWTEFSPHHISELARNGRMQEALELITRMVLSTMPPEYYAWREQKWADHGHVEPAALTLNYREDPRDSFWCAVGRSQHHYEHKPTCSKGAAAQVRRHGGAWCRLCFKRPPSEETRLLLIKKMPERGKPFTDEVVEQLTQERAEQLIQCAHHACLCDPLEYHPAPPLLFAERRPAGTGTAHSTELGEDGLPVRAVTLHRAQVFAECNEPLIRAAMCNINLAMLHSAESAISCAAYLSQYVTKGDGDMNVATATVIAAAADQRAAGNDPNRAVGPLTLVNRFAMAAGSMIETPATMAALAMIGGRRYMTNATFIMVFPMDEIANMPLDWYYRVLDEAVARDARMAAEEEEADEEEQQLEEQVAAEEEFDPDEEEYNQLNGARGIGGEIDLGEIDADFFNEPPAQQRAEGEHDVIRGADGRLIIDKQWENYRLRPHECERMCALEYFCTTEEEPLRQDAAAGAAAGAAADRGDDGEDQHPPQNNNNDNNNNNNNNNEGRERNPRWNYLAEHPRHATAVVKLRSKFRYPALSGYRPPTLPRAGVNVGDAASRMRQMWAWYWALLLIPWRIAHEWHEATFGLMHYYVEQGLRDAGDPSRRAAAYYVCRSTWGMTTNAVCRRIFQAYRFSHADKLRNNRGAIVVANEGGAGAEGGGGEEQGGDEQGDDADVMQYAELFNALNGLNAAVADEARAAEDVRRQYGQIFGQLPAPAGDAAADAAAVGNAAVRFCDDRAKVELIDAAALVKVFEPLQRGPREVDPEEVNRNNNNNARRDDDDNGLEGDAPIDCRGHPEYIRLNAAQRAFVHRVFAAVVDQEGAVDHRVPRLFWLDGAAGCGKTFATRILMDTVRRRFGSRSSVLACAFQGNAACNLEFGAVTLHRALGIKAFGQQRRANEQGAAYLRANHGDLRLVVVDEISMVPADMLATLDMRLGEVIRNDVPFGGCVVLAMGDFYQLPPVKGESLHRAAMRAAVPANVQNRGGIERGGGLWRWVVRLRLNVVVRAEGCAIQRDRLALMRAQGTFPRPLFDGIAVLNAEAVRRDPRWNSHTSLHATNAARHAAGDLHLRRAAASTGKLLYRWRVDRPESLTRLRIPEDRIDRLYGAVPEMSQNFLEGGDFMLLENLNVAVGLTNGAIGKAHAIHFAEANRADIERVVAAARGAQEHIVIVPPGITPISVELAFPIPANAERDALPGRIVGDKWIVPLAKSKLDAVKIPNAPKPIAIRGFAMTQASALTFHKSQGLTLAPLVLDLAKPARGRGGTNMTWEMLYVGLSRAPSNADVLTVGANQSVDYLFSKKANPITVAYLREDMWDPNTLRRRFPGEDAPARRGNAAAAAAAAAADAAPAAAVAAPADVAAPAAPAAAAPAPRGRGGRARGGRARAGAAVRRQREE